MNRKRFYISILAAIMIASTSVTAFAAPAPAAPPASTSKSSTAATSSVFANVTVTVLDKTTASTGFGGRGMPATAYYFTSADDKDLGHITRAAYLSIMEKYRVLDPKTNAWVAPANGGDWRKWFSERFNEYRGLASGNTISNSSGSSSVAGSANNSSKVDTEEYALEVIKLVNKERADAGLNELTIDEDLMELAGIRAKEIVDSFSHERPDGSHVKDLGYGENCSFGKSTPSIAVTSWMESPGHNANILREKYNSTGVGCYQSKNGNLYWVQIFSK